MIRFSAALVVVAIGILVGGVATSRLLLVYVAIAVSAAALVALAIGVVLKREELFGEQSRTSADVDAVGAGTGASFGQPALAGQAAAGVAGVAGVAAMAHSGPGGDRGRQSAFGQQDALGQAVYGQPGSLGQGAGVSAARDWPAWDADSRPAQPGARGREGARQSPPPFEAPRTDVPPTAARLRGTDVPAGAWYEEPDQATPWRLSSRSDAPSRGRHAGPVRSDGSRSSMPGTDGPGLAGGGASGPAAAGPAASSASASSTSAFAPPPPAPPAPPTQPVRQVQPATSDWPPPPSHPSRPAWPPAPSWFDHTARPEPAADAPQADAGHAEQPASTTNDKAPSASAPGETRSEKSAADESAPAAGTSKADAIDESADDLAIADRADDIADHGAGADAVGDSAVGDSAFGDAAADDRGADPAADMEAAVAKTAGAPIAEAGTGDDGAGADAGVEPTETDAAGRASADIDDPDSERADAVVGSSGPAGSAATAPSEVDVATEAATRERPDSGQPAGRQRGDAKNVTVVPGVPRYHDANCILIRFMGDDDLRRMTVPEATAAGCTPCRACQPDSDAE